MKREYHIPEVAVVMFDNDDIVTASQPITGLPEDMEDMVDWGELLGTK